MLEIRVKAGSSFFTFWIPAPAPTDPAINPGTKLTVEGSHVIYTVTKVTPVPANAALPSGIKQTKVSKVL